MRSPATLLLFAAFAAPLAADTVHLVNGNKFEEVVAEIAPGEVRIRMPHGEIVLPDKVVARVERSSSVWQVFGERQDALRGTGASAKTWLELAHWADEAGYPEGMRQAALRAGEIDPELDGLALLMSRVGHVFDGEAGEWLAEVEYMRRRGYRLWGDHWLPREEYATRLRAHEEAQARRREDARQERIARAIEALVVAQLSQAAEPDPEPIPIQAHGPLVAVYPGYFPFVAPIGPAPPAAGPGQSDFDDLARRQPGSLFPIQPRRHLKSSD